MTILQFVFTFTTKAIAKEMMFGIWNTNNLNHYTVTNTTRQVSHAN